MSARYEFIDAEKALYPVVLDVLGGGGVHGRGSTTGAPGRTSATAARRRELASRGAAGFRRLRTDLRLPAGARRAGPRQVACAARSWSGR